MKKLLLILGAVCSQAFATTAPTDAVEKMVAQSEFYMNCDLCQVGNDATPYKPGTFYQLYIGSTRYLIPIEDYTAIRNAGKDVGVSGLFVMSEKVQDACRADWDGSVCRAARLLWKQEWPVGQCVTPKGTVYTAVRK